MVRPAKHMLPAFALKRFLWRWNILNRLMTLVSIITCPHCGYAAVEQMPPNVCQIFHDCKGCGA